MINCKNGCEECDEAKWCPARCMVDFYDKMTDKDKSDIIPIIQRFADSILSSVVHDPGDKAIKIGDGIILTSPYEMICHAVLAGYCYGRSHQPVPKPFQSIDE